MKERKHGDMVIGMALLLCFGVWTALIQCIDVQGIGPKGTEVGFANINMWFHEITGVHMGIYVATDWLELAAILVCMYFAWIGLVQSIKRKSLLRVDVDILLLGVYYALVITCYLVFEVFPVNYRPILIDGALEASYPSSTTLLVLSVMPTLKYRIERRMRNTTWRKTMVVFVVLFSWGMVLGRLVSGVHWATDIIGSVLLANGMFRMYRSLAETLGGKHGIQ